MDRFLILVLIALVLVVAGIIIVTSIHEVTAVWQPGAVPAHFEGQKGEVYFPSPGVNTRTLTTGTHYLIRVIGPIALEVIR